ncbi:MAG: ABC transporter substrate-binding protein [Pseudomonadota bacterium]
MNFSRRQFIQNISAGVAASSIAAARLSYAAPLKAIKVFRIYMILFRGETEAEKGFSDYLASRGIAVELTIRDVAQDLKKIPALIEEARALKVDLIYTWGTSVTLAVVGKQGAVDTQKHVTDIPVVFTNVASPEASGLILSRHSSERNLTGTSHVVPLPLQLQAIRAYRPLRRMAVIYNSVEQNSVQVVKELRAAAIKDHFQLQEIPVPLGNAGLAMVSSLPQLMEQVSQAAPDFLYLGPDSFIGANSKQVTTLALQHRIPVFSATEVALREGKALFGLVSRYAAVGRLTARMAEQILVQKLTPAQIPIETLTRFSYIVNMTVAAELDLYPPLKVINFAEIIT